VQDSDDYFLYLWGPGLEMITVSEKVTGEQDTKLQVVNAQSEIVEKDINLRRSGTYDPRSWSPDGMWLATQSASSPGGDLYFFSEDGQVSTHLPANGAIDVLGWLTIDLPFNAQ
jgi:hypothetical protein